nr:hypothetical protein [Polynucleobacter paneuropaeus]
MLYSIIRFRDIHDSDSYQNLADYPPNVPSGMRG